MATETLVGIPFYEEEGQATLDAALANLDSCLNELRVDAPIIVLANGPQTAQGSPLPLTIDHSKYNAQVELINGDQKGEVNAINRIVELANDRGLEKIFITDADISRFPDALCHMWEQQDSLLVGARYRTYPIEVVDAEYPFLSEEERSIYQILEGDKGALIEKALLLHGVERPKRVKGSLMLVDIATAGNMHGSQDVASDSVINCLVGRDQATVAEGARFMHWGRISLSDHVMARLRHYRAAVMRDDLISFLGNQPVVPLGKISHIAKTVEELDTENGRKQASLYLLRCALRSAVGYACLQIALGDPIRLPSAEVSSDCSQIVETYEEAELTISSLLGTLDWNRIREFGKTPPPTTQTNLPRTPLEISKLMQDPQLRQAITESF